MNAIQQWKSYWEVGTRYKKRPAGGWYVVRPDNGRQLGWVVQDRDGNWSAYVTSGAFRGSGPDDEGHVLDSVPLWLSHSFSLHQANPLTTTAIRRDDATGYITDYLWEKKAPAMGFGPHPEVKPWKEATA